MDRTARNAGNAGMAPALLPRPGEVVCGKYRLESVLGTGGMGVVMGAVDTSLGRPVAIKFLAPQKATREGAVARFLREARSAAAIQSEHVVRVFEVSTLPNGAPFIVMEHLRGADLSNVLAQRGALPIEEACDYVLQACEALGEAHARGIVHRDLKPQNLFLTQQADGSPCVKVLDFGISTAAVDDTAPNLTSTDMVMGTPLYMSPEQVRSLKNVDARADIWALGAILFELLTTAPIYQAPSASALCAMIAMDPPTPLRARRGDAPAALEAVILRCLHKDPVGRFQDVAALADALASFGSERGRHSALRISRVVRASGASSQAGPPNVSSSPLGNHAASPMAMMSTMGPAPTTGGAPASFGPSSPPALVLGTEMIQPTTGGPPLQTQNTWHRTNAGSGAERLADKPVPRANGGASVMWMAGAIGGLVFLALAAAGGGAWYFVVRKDATTAAAAVTADASTVDPPGAMSGSPVPTVSVTASASTVPAPPPTPTPRERVPAAKDAGVPPVAKDGGAPAPDKDKEEAERNAALGKAAEAQCANHRRQMTTFARDEATRKRAAAQARTFMCRGMASSRCERQVCMEACLVLDDQPCIQQMRYVIDHGPAPKY